MMVQSTGKTSSSTEQLLQLGSKPKATTNASKDDASKFDKMVQERFEQGTNAAEGVTEDITEQPVIVENQYPPVVFQWMTTMPGQFNVLLQETQVVENLPTEDQLETGLPPLQMDEAKNLLVQELEGINKQPATEEGIELPVTEMEVDRPQGVQQTSQGKLEEDVQVNQTDTLKGTEESPPKDVVLEFKQSSIGQTQETEVETPRKSDVVHVSQPSQVEMSQPTSVKEPTQTSASTYVSKPEYMDQLGDKVAKQIASGKQEFEIQLEPMHLGKMMIKVTYEAGRAAVSIICSEAKTMQAMSQNAKELGGILENHLGTQTQIIVDKGQPADYLEQGHQQDKERQDQEAKQNNKEKDNDDMEMQDFLQQLRLGLV